MAKYVMEMVLEYPKVFEENLDMGDLNGPRVAQAIAEKGGQFIVNGYFTNSDQIKKLISEGLDPTPMNSQRIVEGNSEFGIGKFMKLKRDKNNIKVFQDKFGKDVEVDYGGTPKVVDLTKGEKDKRMWSFEEDGALGNGTVAKVQFETYANGAGVRLMNIGVLNHVAYETSSGPSEDDKLFMVN
jgi:hypothetical protein|tara:strand:- start:1042 stop:1593 length:552 start_codon:yes stop_codon:yes gene_type:complete